MLIKNYFRELSSLRLYILSIILIITFSYSIYIFCSNEVISKLCDEDSFFECLTAIFFLLASVLCFVTFKRNKNIFVLGLAMMLFIGMGEEISWGQRIIGFATPGAIKKVNVQQETNIHNLEVFNIKYMNGVKKTSLQRLLEINMLFRIFSVSFLILLPLIIYQLKFQKKIKEKFKLPIAPVSMGIFFLMSWAIFYSIKRYLLSSASSAGIALSVGEVFECTAAYLYFAVALYFYNTKDDSYLGANSIEATVNLKQAFELSEFKITAQSN